MCSGNAFVPPRDWNHELHNLVGCDHVSVMARQLDAFLEDFMLAHHYNRPVEPVETHPFLGHEQPDPKKVDLAAVLFSGFCAEVVPCTFKFFTRPGYCTGFWVRQHGRQIEHFENESDARAKCEFLNRVQQVPQSDAAAARRIITEDLESCLMPDKFTETDGTDGKTAADCFAKGGYLTGQPQTTFGGIPVAPPIDLPPVEVKPRVRGLASLRRSWRVR